MKNNIRIITQKLHHTAEEFAQELEVACNQLSDKYKNSIRGTLPQVQFMTTESDGRQTATIQFITQENGNVEDIIDKINQRLEKDGN